MDESVSIEIDRKLDSRFRVSDFDAFDRQTIEELDCHLSETDNYCSSLSITSHSPPRPFRLLNQF